ncbi:MAG: hypothetical protein IJK64_09530 [Clostridia bacterium]|nr:hypothetical protein [Clostridia bacterium]
MKEYKVAKVREKDAEATMNAMAQQGWTVVSVTYWSCWWVHLVITFVRET